MGIEERRAWIALVLAVATYGAYAVVVLTRVVGESVGEVGYRAPLLWAVGISIALSIVFEAIATGSLPRGGRRTDDRDREIVRAGENAGHWILVIGAFGALVLALVEADPFWIANVLYLAFTVAAILEATVKIGSYRTGSPLW